MSCGYRHLGACSGEKEYIIKKYFSSGKDLRFCEKHAKDWNNIHPFGPIAAKDKRITS